MVARIWLYRLLARLFHAAPDGKLLRALGSLPDLFPYLPAPGPEVEWLEQMAVVYQDLFGFNVLLYESLYRDDDLMVNSASAQQVAALYESYHFVAAGDSGAPDHLSHELDFVAALLETEYQATQVGDESTVRWAMRERQLFLQNHLAYWWPIAVLAIRRIESSPLYEVMAEVALELVLGDLNLSEGLPLPAHSVAATPPAAEQSLGWLVRQLLTPDIVGLFLTRADLTRLAQSLSLPLVRGDRVTMLRSLLESAAQFEQFPALLESVKNLWIREQGALGEFAAQFPLYSSIASQWQERLQNGLGLLHEMNQTLAQNKEGDEDR